MYLKFLREEYVVLLVIIFIFTQDILEFVDVCHETFVGNLWLVISSYKEMFLRSPDEAGR